MLKASKLFWLIVWFLCVISPMARAQNNLSPAIIRFGYADQIVVNGKIVSMDDQGYNSNPGHTYEAMALKGSRIMALGSTAEIRALAAPDAKVIDLGGRLVIPGIIDSHSHLFGNPALAKSLGMAYPDKGVAITVSAGRDIEATRMKVENAIKDQVAKLHAGDWVYVGVNPNTKEGASAARVADWVSRGDLEPRQRLTQVAPQNPVQVQAGSRATINTAAWDLLTKMFPDFEAYEQGEIPDVPDDSKLGVLGVGAMTAIEWDIWYGHQPTSMLTEMIRRDWEMAVANGQTAFGSRVYNPKVMDAITLLNRLHQAPMRMMVLMETHRKPNEPKFTREMYQMTGNLTGIGDDMMWMGGVASELWDSSFPQDCLGPDVPAPQNIKIRERCLKPGDLYWDTLQNAVEAGWRLAGIHGVASHGVRLYTQMLERAMKNANISVDDMRAMHFTTDHAEALGNVPDVMNKLKELNIIVSPNPIRMLKAKDYIQDYGPGVEKFIEPVKSWLDEGVNVVGQFEGYHGMGYQFYLLTTRDVNGTPVLPEQKLDRVTALKMWTTWAPTYMMKNDIGTLQVGKLADFVVLDRDFFTIPLVELQQIVPQMTVVGGKIGYLGVDFAKSLGMEPVGYQFPEGYKPWDRSSMAATDQ